MVPYSNKISCLHTPLISVYATGPGHMSCAGEVGLTFDVRQWLPLAQMMLAAAEIGMLQLVSVDFSSSADWCIVWCSVMTGLTNSTGIH